VANMKTVSLIAIEVGRAREEARRDLLELYDRLDADVANLNAAIDQIRAAVEKLQAKQRKP
jgi:hypothetical protein